MLRLLKINTNSNSTIINTFLVLIAGLVLPACLILIVKLTGYSEIIEEISKAVIILFFITQLGSYKKQFIVALLFGFLFGLSESMFYLNSILMLGDFSLFLKRLIFTIPMHMLTVVLILLPTWINRKLIFLGLTCSIIIHLLFNNFVVNLF